MKNVYQIFVTAMNIGYEERINMQKYGKSILMLLYHLQ